MKGATVAVVGLGLIGGSLARGLTRAGYFVLGVDRPRIRRRARAWGFVSASCKTAEEAARRAAIVVLAAPPRANIELLGRLSRTLDAQTVVTDVSSVKGPICREADRLGLKGFVGGHPLAGSEGSGLGSSSADLFRGSPWILTPVGRAPRPLQLVLALVRSVGARPSVMTPREHDRLVAFLSHVPQLVSWALLGGARRDPVAGRALHLAGPAFRQMTRLASSPRALWREIVEENKSEVRRALRAFSRALQEQP